MEFFGYFLRRHRLNPVSFLIVSVVSYGFFCV